MDRALANLPNIRGGLSFTKRLERACEGVPKPPSMSSPNDERIEKLYLLKVASFFAAALVAAAAVLAGRRNCRDTPVQPSHADQHP